jgi:seryl-tRNA synthetase
VDRKLINHRINMLYRQLGKNLYEDKQRIASLSKEQNKLIKQIETMIEKLSKVEENREEYANKLPEDATILAPTKNDDGYYLYRFCPKCQVGNNPESTHCSKCYEPL